MSNQPNTKIQLSVCVQSVTKPMGHKRNLINTRPSVVNSVEWHVPKKVILQHHRRTHTKENPHLCQHFKKAFTICSALRRLFIKAYSFITSILSAIRRFLSTARRFSHSCRIPLIVSTGHLWLSRWKPSSAMQIHYKAKLIHIVPSNLNCCNILINKAIWKFLLL